jgi:hypothetical protein
MAIREVRISFAAALMLICVVPSVALAGPPYVTDDPEPTDFRHFEIYVFADGAATHDGRAGETGIAFNYGGAPDLQLSTTVALVDCEIAANFDPSRPSSMSLISGVNSNLRWGHMLDKKLNARNRHLS